MTNAPAEPTAVPPTNPVATAALIFAFLVPPLGLALGLVAGEQIRNRGERGRRIATAGVVVGAVLSALSVAAVLGAMTLLLLVFEALAWDASVG